MKNNDSGRGKLGRLRKVRKVRKVRKQGSKQASKQASKERGKHKESGRQGKRKNLFLPQAFLFSYFLCEAYSCFPLRSIFLFPFAKHIPMSKANIKEEHDE